MNQKKVTIWTLIGSALVLGIVFVLFYYMQSSQITAPVILPDTDNLYTPSESPSVGSEVNMALSADVNTNTVQVVIASLQRPKSYSREIIVESYWSGGSVVYQLQCWVRPEGSKIIRTSSAGGSAQHVIVTDERIYIWYEGDRQYYSAAVADAGLKNISDAYQMIATYEDLLEKSVSDIQEAGYEEYNGKYCIFAKTQQGEYTESYYVLIESGLLEGMEKWDGTSLIYRMKAGNVQLSVPEDSVFDLPDGTNAITADLNQGQ